ncbi:SRPBCC domain-containing protein [Flavobacterium sp. MAH-1]|uniref:SRPBCC domain-containing protein n=1 Tax=Flavobacterium agri TaxID=2743471 RepID=A0A7Y8Y3V0_9FLAO|nr:SRPBCC domain-containing protein [Flavobacterium agri]NUY82017.1 SRPBCC domain-containing protein [Flavobacterium agri]NYA72041.1 SRPBCC domain-containing protein [Flavobacterium agri]
MDISEKEPLIYDLALDAPIQKVWQAISDKDKMVQWYFPMMEDFKPQVGFVTQFDVVHPESGNHYQHKWTVTEALDQRKLSYEWNYPDYPGNGLLTFELEPNGDKTHLKLTFKALESFEPQKYPELSMANFNEGWTYFTNALADFVNKQ